MRLHQESGEKLDRIRLRDGGTVRCLDAARYLDTRALADFATHISRIGPSVIVAANPYALMYSSLALRRSRVHAPLVVTFHTTLLQSVKEWLQMIYYRPSSGWRTAWCSFAKKQRRYWLRRGVSAKKRIDLQRRGYGGVLRRMESSGTADVAQWSVFQTRTT